MQEKQYSIFPDSGSRARPSVERRAPVHRLRPALVHRLAPTAAGFPLIAALPALVAFTLLGNPRLVPAADDRDLVRRIHEAIVAKHGAGQEREMIDYDVRIPGTSNDYRMIAIPGGTFIMGSPPSETGRTSDEGPQKELEISPFWIGRTEVTVSQFAPFADRVENRVQPIDPTKGASANALLSLAAAVSGPSDPAPYGSYYGFGTPDQPAAGMTHHAASKYCQWLSALTGDYYRLPTEAEWEYACRAGTTTAYYFGDDPARLAEFEVFDPDLTRVGPKKVGSKKPNPWGLHDMHGNVIEWCLDQYRPKPPESPFARVPATSRYPRVAKGGSWYDTAEFLRSAARAASSPDWQAQDPSLPKSMWWLTDAGWLGFRIVRPLAIPSEEVMYQLWNSATGLTDPEQ